MRFIPLFPRLPNPVLQVPFRRLVLTLALGAAGGWAFNFFGLPLAWMLGAMTIATVSALSGVPLAMDQRLRKGMVAVLGIMIGSAFTPDIIGQLGSWIPSLAGLAVYTLSAVVISGFYFRRVAGYDPLTAHFSAVPGGVTEMTLVGGALGADERTVSLSHGMRILVVVFVVPLWFRYFEGFQGTGLNGLESSTALSVSDLLILALCAIVGAPLAHRLKVPAAYLIGPLVLSAAFHLSGVTAARPPVLLVAIAQVVLGTAIGCRFAGFKVREVLRTMMHGVTVILILLALTLVFGAAIAAVTGLERKALYLALAPGGVTEMSLVALALGVDIAFVTTHHLARIVMVVVLAPLTYRLFGGAGKKAP